MNIYPTVERITNKVLNEKIYQLEEEINVFKEEINNLRKQYKKTVCNFQNSEETERIVRNILIKEEKKIIKSAVFYTQLAAFVKKIEKILYYKEDKTNLLELKDKIMKELE